jgi:hypothetical protein
LFSLFIWKIMFSFRETYLQNDLLIICNLFVKNLISVCKIFIDNLFFVKVILKIQNWILSFQRRMYGTVTFYFCLLYLHTSLTPTHFGTKRVVRFSTRPPSLMYCAKPYYFWVTKPILSNWFQLYKIWVRIVRWV